ncbi:MAG: hypothetical protein CME70_20640 [Halobacteriovorax sp.]|nr:hypothetical protein [Halobacteriovorax sp.]|tara:strand:- start:45 stop:977 length:933 start_codon:yes stop_codon:yes gene_type:complete
MEELSVTEFDRDIGELELPALKLMPPDSSLYEAILYFKDNRQGLIGIGDEGKMSGILTEWDVVHHFDPGIDPSDVKVSELAIENPVTLYSENTLYEVMNVMGRRNLPAFPVCDEDGKPKFIFNTEVLFHYLTSFFKDFLSTLGTKENWDPTKAVQAFTEGFSYSETMEDDSSLHQNYFLTPFERIPSSKLVKIDKSTTIKEAWTAIVEQKTEALVITDYGTKLVGILTPRDLIIKVLTQKGNVDLKSPVTEYMTSAPHSLMYKHPIGYGVNHFLKYGYKHMIVVDEDRIPLKVVSLLEIFSHLIDKVKLN